MKRLEISGKVLARNTFNFIGQAVPLLAGNEEKR